MTHPEHTPLADAAAVSRARGVLTAVEGATLAALTFDGFVCAVLAVLFLPLYVGSTALPVSAVVAGVVNVVLVRAAARVSRTPGGAALPVVGFGIGFFLCALGGPGGDSLVLADWRTLLLIVGGMGPAAALMVTARVKAIGALARAGRHERDLRQ